MTQITNCHSHIFTIHNIPERFLPLRLVRYLARNNRTRRLARALNWLNPFSNHDLLDRYANFIRQSDKPNQRAILEDLMSYYPSDSKFVILSTHILQDINCKIFLTVFSICTTSTSLRLFFFSFSLMSSTIASINNSLSFSNIPE